MYFGAYKERTMWLPFSWSRWFWYYRNLEVCYHWQVYGKNVLTCFKIASYIPVRVWHRDRWGLGDVSGHAHVSSDSYRRWIEVSCHKAERHLQSQLWFIQEMSRLELTHMYASYEVIHAGNELTGFVRYASFSRNSHSLFWLEVSRKRAFEYYIFI
jgi:hypothetical protein